MVEAPHAPRPPNPPLSPPLLAAHNITKRFPGVVANDNISFELRAGEVHALLGENGAGKTTLISMLYGLLEPDEGTIELGGEPVRLRSPRDAIARGVGLVAQHFMLVPRHTVAENIALGLSGVPFWRPTRRLRARIGELSARYGLEVDPDAYVRDLSAGEQQRVELVKALVRGAEVLILDEPTGVLTPGEAERLFEVMAAMKRQGHAIVFITHKLGEVMAAADRVSVLRKGAVVGQVGTAHTSTAELARLMVGREVVFTPLRAARPPGERVLGAKNLSAKGERGEHALKGVSFNLHAGEMLGVAGVAGNGQRELTEVLTGLRALQGGTLTLKGRDLSKLSVRERFEAGVAHIPEERLGVGVVPSLSAADNLALRGYRYPPFSRGPFLDAGALRRAAAKALKDYQIAAPSPRTSARLLSGGNIQKLILARELSGTPGIIVAAHPTYGLDVGATELTHTLLAAARARGAGVLLVSEDLDELLRLCDRIMVLFAGESMGTVAAEGAERGQLGLMMAGAARA